ncbi:hypothetical protein [Stenotrophomonas rhizophila]|uniref:hypothetical protein n=1 Tax=Stenotrophomonas rhizophila TaxID=216778 RepID=UPI0004569EB3|nr:hypothetical protein [Stenotrophomonas rhizophila]AHY58964.1 hypothetical protein DX03_09810 [Stenotrophomonas rhizophila]
MQLHEMWRQAYGENRFLRHLSEDELQQRVRDVVLNMITLTPQAKIGLGSPKDPEAQRFMLKWTQVLEEMKLRYGPYPNGFTNGFIREQPLSDFVGELGRKAASVFAALDLDPRNSLVKYGKSEHMAALLSQGNARIQPASFFKASHLNGAVRDDELSLALSIVVSRADLVALVKNPHDVPNNSGDQVLRANHTAEGDYWLYCVTQSVEPRLFCDFEAQACLIIRNKKAFAERLRQAADYQIPSSEYSCGDAMYVDPHQPETARISVPFAKHFRYTYQREYRFAWIPRVPAQALSPVDLTMGALDDIATLVEL